MEKSFESHRLFLNTDRDAPIIVHSPAPEREHEIDTGLLRASRPAEYHAELLEAASAAGVSVGVTDAAALQCAT